MHVNGFDCHALCDLGASISIMSRKIYDICLIYHRLKSVIDKGIDNRARQLSTPEAH
jgi:hypothetical protein